MTDPIEAPITDPENESVSSEPTKILIVDDDAHIRRALSILLKIPGCETIEAEDGRQALERLEQAGDDVKLIISDIMMPNIDGLELCRRLKADEMSRDIYFIMLTAREGVKDRVKGLEIGADDYVQKPFDATELRARVKAGLRIVNLQSELKNKNRILHQLSITDGLTGAYNHSYFQRAFEKEFERARRYTRDLSLLVCDIDNFKGFNDRFGHGTGDTVLTNVARIVRSITRDSDIVARYGGEEFVVLIPETPLETAYQVADKIRIAIAEAGLVVEEQRLDVTISIGAACFNGENFGSRTAFFNSADSALYRAKHEGKNRVVCV
ncbi:MAG: diguanylate cyclase [Planctomycetota bacterium]